MINPCKILLCCCLMLVPASWILAQKLDSLPFDYKRDFKKILELTQDPASDICYKKLIIRYLDRDPSLTKREMLALLIGFTEEPHYKPFEDMEIEKEIFALNDEGNVEEALLKVLPYLQTHPLSLSGLKEASYCYHSMKKEDSATYYMDLVDKVMDGMIYSGKGKKPEEPIFSLGLADGEHFIPNVGMKVLNKDTEWNKNNHFLEVIDASKNLDDHINYYFVIDHAKQKIDDDQVNEAADKKAKKNDKKGKWGKKDKKDKKDSKDSKSKGSSNTAPVVTTPAISQ